MYTRIDDFSSQDSGVAMTIGELITMCEKYPYMVFKFWDTGYSPDELISWRGDYHKPCITYTAEDKKGIDFLSQLLTYPLPHEGYKGGEFTFELSDSPYIAQYGSSGNETKIVGYEVNEHEITLLTQVVPY